MKSIDTTKLNDIVIINLLLIGLLVVTSCSKDENLDDPINPEASSIDAYIEGLSYDPNNMLNVQDTGGAPSQRTITSEEDESYPIDGTLFQCNIKDYSLESNFDQVSILRPTNGIIYPGALVKGDQGMLDGAPTPLAIARGPIALTLDLPGLGSNGTILVDNPALSGNVKTGLDNALSWWNNNAYQEGYVNAANSTYSAANSYSSTQLSLDIGLNVEWSNGSFATQLQYESSTEERVASIVFKQVFYTVDVNTPLNPSNFFSNDVTLAEVESEMNETNPPAYVSSVAYGRIIMIRMQSSNTTTSIGLDAVLKYASGVSATATVDYDMEEIIENSSIDVITIGGNAEVATSAINAANVQEGPGSLSYIITGENAVYSTTNPGVPIAYQVRYMRDNSLAKMGYTTDYTVEECGSGPFYHDEVTVENDSYHDTRFRFKYRPQNQNFIYYSQFYELNQDDVLSRTPPSGSHDVEIQFEYQYGAGGWNFIEEDEIGYLYNEECYKFTGGDIWGEASDIGSVNCN